jgi:endonuclease/exonuclease/phosphatase family metal-dependent hydrolase
VILTTWNMQGGNAATETKWQTGVANLLRNALVPPDAICLQEASGVPRSAVQRQAITQSPAGGLFTNPLTGNVETVRVFDWLGTRTRPGCTIIHHANTAIVTQGRLTLPATVQLVWGGGPVWRPALGVLYRGSWLFSFHAISPRGADTRGILAQVAITSAGVPWWVGGDFNRDPTTFNRPNQPPVLPANSVICPPNQPTHSVTNPRRRYDYFVRSGANGAIGIVEQSIVFSDHYPVDYAF